MNVKITPQEIVKQNELQINLFKAFEFTLYVMGYQVCKDRWTPAVVEPKNKEDKFAVAIIKDDCLGGHLPKETTGKFAKIIFYFLQAYEKPSIKEMEKE